MNQSDKEFAARLFKLNMDDVDNILREAKRNNMSFAELVDDYKSYQQTQALLEPCIRIRRRENIFKIVYNFLRNKIRIQRS